MIDEISPESFNGLIQISGLSHGTGVWFDNAQQLIKKELPVGKCLAYHDDVFNRVQEKLEAKNLSNTGYAYKLMEDTICFSKVSWRTVCKVCIDFNVV